MRLSTWCGRLLAVSTKTQKIDPFVRKKEERLSGADDQGLSRAGVSALRWRRFCALSGGLFYSFTYHWGRQLDRNGNVNFKNLSGWMWILVTAAVVTVLLDRAFAWLEGRAAKRNRAKQNSAPAADSTGRKEPGCRGLLKGAVGLFLAWTPVFLAVFPGFFAYDATDELQEVLTGQYVTRHPLLHVLMLGKTVSGIGEMTGRYNLGIAVYVLLQMAVMALLLSWVLEKVRKLGAPRWLARVCALFFAFFPVIPMYVLCTSKDIVYTAGMLAAMVLLAGMAGRESGQERNAFFWPALALSLFVMAVFRNNGFYVLLVMVPVLLLLAGKGRLKKMLFVLAFVLAARAGLNAALNAALQPVSTDSMETLTVPIQQLARTWKYSPELFDETDQETLFEILPGEVLARYNPKLSDMVKIDFQTQNYEKNPGKYQALWLKMGLKVPFTYVNAWFMTSYGFWYPFTVIDVYNGNRYYAESSYFSCETESPGWQNSFFPALQKVYQEISWGDSVHRIPVISWLFSPGFLCWVYVFALLYFLSQKRWRSIGVMAPAYLNWLTVLLGPTYLVRYVLIFWFALPLLLTQLLSIDGQVCYTPKDNGKSGTVCP